MKRIQYSKWGLGDWDELSLHELMEQLSDFLLESGFHEQFRKQLREVYGDEFQEDPEEALNALREAIREALQRSEILSKEQYQQLFDERGEARNEELGRLIEELLAKLLSEGFLSLQNEDGAVDWYLERDEAGHAKRVKLRNVPGETEDYKPQAVRFEVTQKGVDFLGYKQLKHLLSSVGASTFGRHDTDKLSTGVELVGSSKQYEFGDTMNIDPSRTLLSAIQRNGLPLDVHYDDIFVQQSEYQSSCATVLMLDCSHSMILYGEDRFTPAKRVTLALSHLIKTQYPGDSLHLVLFHDSAEEIPLSKLASVMVGPFHTNTAEGLKLARRILLRERKEMRQIIMITDGKPSALFIDHDTRGKKQIREDGSRRLYKNSAGLDPVIISETLKQAAECRRAGILINTFMLTDDYYLVEFVKQLTQIADGTAYFTSTMQLGDYVMMDFMRGKRSRVR